MNPIKKALHKEIGKNKDVRVSKVHGEKQYSIKERMKLNYPKGFPHH